MATRMSKTAPPSNVTDETYDKHLNIILAAEADMAKATEEQKRLTAIYRTALKAAKKDGCNQQAIVAALQMRKKDQDDQRMLHRDMGRVLKLLGMPIGHQFDLFGQDVPLVDRSVDEDNATTAADGGSSLEMAYNQGEAAGKAGISGLENPYGEGDDRRTPWANGWRDGQAIIAAQLDRTTRESKKREGAGAIA